MQFKNIQVSWNDIPQMQALQLQKIHPNYLQVLRISWLITYVIVGLVAAACFFWIEEIQKQTLIIIAVVVFIFLLLLTHFLINISFQTMAYGVREKDIVYKTGYIFQDIHIIPLNRMQHCVVKSGPIERKYNLASLSLYTAAVGIHDITIHGLLQVEAEQLREWILQQKQFTISQDDGI